MAPLRRYRPKEVIIKEGDLGETAYIIERGRVSISAEKDGKTLDLGFMSVGDIFGEMSIIDDKPRSATVIAVENTVLKEIHRDEFLNILQNDQDAAIKILKRLFNRLREANSQLLQLQAEMGKPAAEFDSVTLSPEQNVQVSLVGLTSKATAALPTTPFVIESFPFRIGRRSPDPLAHNDLTIPDAIPYQVSRHHLMIVNSNNRIGVLDLGSTLGAELDGQRLGGRFHNPGPVFIRGDEGTLVLGVSESPFRYKIQVERR